MKKIGILYDNISGNTGDVAIGLSVKKILQQLDVAFEELVPGNFNPLEYDTIIIGGGHLLRPSPDFYYDKFRVPGKHILNAAGIVDVPQDLDYLNEYRYVTVRDTHEREKLAYLKCEVNVVPCTSMLLEDLPDFSCSLKNPCIGMHISPLFSSAEEEDAFVRWASSLPFTIYFLPITHYNRDIDYMRKLQARIPNAELLPILTAQEIFTLIGKFDYFISCSLHGAIFSYCHNVPFILYNVLDKMRFFMEDRDLKSYLFANFDEMQSSLAALIGRKPDYTERLHADYEVLGNHVARIKSLLPAGPGISRNYSESSSQTTYQINALLQDLSHLGHENSSLEKKYSDLDQKFTKLEARYSALETDSADLKRKISELETTHNQLKNSHSQLERITSELATNNTDLKRKKSELETANADLKEHVNHLNNLVNSTNNRIMKLKTIVSLTQQENDALKRSITYKATQKFHRKIVERLLHPNSRRRRYYDLSLEGGRILANEGWAGFWGKCKKKFKHHVFKKEEELYLRWIETNESGYTNRGNITADIATFSFQPKISIVVPVWEVEKNWLILMIESVLHQVYQNWELCIVDAGSTKPHVRKILGRYQAADPRIKVKFLDRNGGISENTNEALKMAGGEYIGFLDHDDELAPFALYEVVKYLNDNPDVKLIYSDEDKIHPGGLRSDPFFKPDWSPDQFLSHNYLCHFCVIKKEILPGTNQLRRDFDGSQDYDLLLRLTENLRDNEIGHIQKILYHWRVIPSSTSYSIGAKPVAITSSKRAIQEALDRRRIPATVTDGKIQDTYRVKYEILGNPRVSIIIPTKDHVQDLKKCISSIIDKTSYDNYEIIVVNNDSQDTGTYEFFKEIRKNNRIKIIDDNEEFNFSRINNFAVRESSGELLLFLNNDTEVISNEWLTSMIEHAQRPGVGAVGAKLLYPDNTVQHAGVILGIGPAGSAVAGHSHKYAVASIPGYFSSLNLIRNYSAVTAACMMMRKDIFEKVGGFDENLQIAFNDVDLCMKIRAAGYSIVYTPFAELYHFESKSRGYENTPEKARRFNSEIRYFRSRWGAEIEKGDPFYNKNLTHRKEDFSLNVED